MTVPPLTAAQRSDALARAAAARTQRAELKSRLQRSEVTLPDVLEAGLTDEVVARMRVLDLLEAMPGIGPVRARDTMTRLGIAESRRVRGLGTHQRAALEREFGPR